MSDDERKKEVNETPEHLKTSASRKSTTSQSQEKVEKKRGVMSRNRKQDGSPSPTSTKNLPHFVANIPIYVPSDSDGESSDESSDETFPEEYFDRPPFRIKTDKRGKMEAEAPMLPHEFTGVGKVESKLQQKILNKLDKEGLLGDKHEKKNRLSVSFGLNRPFSLSSRKNELLYTELTAELQTPFETKSLGFFWNYQWEETSIQRNGRVSRLNDASHERVRSFYKQLKRRDPGRAREFRRSQENQPRNSMVPYREIRESLKNHSHTKELISNARIGSTRDIYLSFIDGDTQAFKKEGEKGIYEEYTAMYLSSPTPPDAMSTGYEYSDLGTDSLIEFASTLDRRVRAATAKHVPNGVYYPEPNFCIRVQEQEDTVKESFLEIKLTPTGRVSRAKTLIDYKSPQEAVLILKQVSKRDDFQALFSKNSPLLTKTPPRAKSNKKGTPLKFNAKRVGGIYKDWSWDDVINISRNIAQSHVKGRDWAGYILHAYQLIKEIQFKYRDGLTVGFIAHGSIIREAAISLLSRLYGSYDPVRMTGVKQKGSKEAFIQTLINYDKLIKNGRIDTNTKERKKTGVEKEFWEQIDSSETREQIKKDLTYLLPNCNMAAIENAAKDSGKAIADTFREFFDIPGLPKIPRISTTPTFPFSSSLDSGHSGARKELFRDDKKTSNTRLQELPTQGLAISSMPSSSPLLATTLSEVIKFQEHLAQQFARWGAGEAVEEAIRRSLLGQYKAEDDVPVGSSRSISDIDRAALNRGVEASLQDPLVAKRKEDLKEAATLYGYNCNEVEADGNCFFHAVAAQLQSLGREGQDIEHDTLRMIVAVEIGSHPDRYHNFIPAHEREQLAGDMAKEDEWVGQIAAQAIARLKKVIVVIIPHDKGRPQVVKPVGATEMIVLGNEVGFHFQSLIAKTELSRPRGAATLRLQELIDDQPFLDAASSSGQAQQAEGPRSEMLLEEKSRRSLAHTSEPQKPSQLEPSFSNSSGTEIAPVAQQQKDINAEVIKVSERLKGSLTIGEKKQEPPIKQSEVSSLLFAANLDTAAQEWAEKGIKLCNLGKHEDALKFFFKELEHWNTSINPDKDNNLKECNYHIGSCYFYLDKRAEAIKYLNEAVRLDQITNSEGVEGSSKYVKLLNQCLEQQLSQSLSAMQIRND